MGLLDRIAAIARRSPAVPDAGEQRSSIDQWLSDYLIPSNQFNFGGNSYPFGLSGTWTADRVREISNTMPGYMAALRLCPPAYAAQMVRAVVLSQARFVFRNNRISRTPGRQFGTSALGLLEKPWPNGTTGELLARMEWHAGLAGNAYVTNRTRGRLRVLRPDWVMIVYGSHQQPEDAAYALDGEIIGYVYCNGGIEQGRYQMETLLPTECAHWSPIPDPMAAGIGMSWITPAIREIQGDRAASDHKVKFFENSATPSMVVKGVQAATKEQFGEIVDAMEGQHAGVRNAYKTLYLAAGADATVVGSSLQQMDFKATIGTGETRISMLSRVHPVILGASEGLAGSSLNAGNFGAARRMWADSWIYPTLQDVAAALAPLISVPADAELWTTTKDMPILREDAKDAADIEQIKATTINTLITAGFTPESVVAAVDAQDMKLLVHSGLTSVQLQKPGEPPGGAAPADPTGPVEPPIKGGSKIIRSDEDMASYQQLLDDGSLRLRGLMPASGWEDRVRALEQRLDDDDDDDGPLDEATQALVTAFEELHAEAGQGTRAAAFTESLHPRNPHGAGGGRFRSIVERIKAAVDTHQKGGGKGDPLKEFSPRQLKRAARKRGVDVKGMKHEDVKKALLAHLDSAPGGSAGVHSRLVGGGTATVKPSHMDELMRGLADVPPGSVNLEHLSVSGAGNEHLFSEHAREIPRTEMPQLPQSLAEFVSGYGDKFAAKGIGYREESVDPRTLVATQNELDASKVGKLYGFIRDGGWQSGAVLIVSREGFVVDGHHRWAAASAANVSGSDLNVDIVRIDALIDDILDITRGAPTADLSAGL